MLLFGIKTRTLFYVVQFYITGTQYFIPLLLELYKKFVIQAEMTLHFFGRRRHSKMN